MLLDHFLYRTRDRELKYDGHPRLKHHHHHHHQQVLYPVTVSGLPGVQEHHVVHHEVQLRHWLELPVSLQLEDVPRVATLRATSL